MAQCNDELSKTKDITSQNLSDVCKNIRELQKQADEMQKINVVMQG